MQRKVLIADDNAMNRELLRGILASDYDVLEAENGEDAMNLLFRSYKIISAVLLDLSMPVMDGYEVLSLMRENAMLSRIPVIVTTGSSDTESELRALSLGANDFVTKPYNPAIIKRRLFNTIRLRENAAIENTLQRDKLTGLYNRKAFFDRAAAIENTHEPGHYTLACFNVESFKVINDQYGAIKGDEVLRQIADVFRLGFDPLGGVCCRVTADNFAILYPAEYMNSPALEEIRRQASVLDGSIPPIVFRIGRYVVDDLTLTVSAMHDRASLAEDSIKGRYDVHIADFDETMRDQLVQEQQIVTDMNSALSGSQFEVWYQPQYNHANGALIGAEALVRWRHPLRGLLIPPGDFIPVFERNGFIYEMDKYIWEKVCKKLRGWLDEGVDPLPISVNISRNDVFHDDFYDVLTGLVEKYGIPTELLRLEITETAFAEATGRIVSIVKRLVSSGFTVEIDDFGSGYSSLNILKDVPADIIKLDMKFLETAEDSRRGGNILESVVRMAKWLGMSVIAEGVETAEQADYLRSIGCSYVQGYLYARPMPEADFDVMLSSPRLRERELGALKTVETLDNNAFWDPASMDTLIFNTYVGGACIIEYNNGKLELLRVNEKYKRTLGLENIPSDSIKPYSLGDHISGEDRALLHESISRAIETQEEVSCEIRLSGLRASCARFTLRVIARAGERRLIYCAVADMTELRRSEQKERELAEQLRVILDNVNSGVSAATLEKGKIGYIFTNDEYFSMFGYTREQFFSELENGLSDLILPSDLPAVHSMAEQSAATGKNTTLEFRAKKRDGSLMWAHVSSSVCRIAGVDAPVHLAVISDITERKQAEDRLRMNEEQFRIAASQGGRTLARYDIKTKTYYNESDILFRQGFSKVIENVPQSFIDRGTVAPESIPEYRAFYDSLSTGIPQNEVTVSLIALDGTYRWFHGDATVIFDEEGSPSQAIVSFYDVTEQREKEAVYRRWQQSLQEKPDNAYTLFRCNLSRDTSFDSVEGSLLHISFSPEALSFNERTREYVEQFVFPDDREIYIATLNSDTLLANYYRGKRSHVLEYRELLRGGVLRWLKLTIELVEYPSSSDIAAYLMYENIDENKRAELLTKERAETDPLTGAFNRTAFVSQVEQLIYTSKIGVQHALLMLDIDGFKTLNDTFGHAVGDDALRDIVTSLRSALRREDLLCRLGGDEFLILLKDVGSVADVEKKAAQLCELLYKRYSPEVGLSVSIGVSLYPRDGSNFETLYRRADAALYYVKRAGKNNFIFYDEKIGAAAPHLAVRPPEALAPDTGKQKKRRILIVDDNRADMELLSNIFCDEYNIEKARDGSEALIRLRHYGSSIAVVLLDLIMPGVDGFDVLEKMKLSAELQSIPIIVVSGDNERETNLRAIRCGAADFVGKPVDPDIIRLRVRSAISKAENERLRAQNSALALQNDEVERYRLALKNAGLLVAECDWGSGDFYYDKGMSHHIAALFDRRKLWQILLSDIVADVTDVQALQKLAHDIADDRDAQSGSIVISLKTPNRTRHRFLISVIKRANEFRLTDKLIFVFKDLDASPDDIR